MILVLGEKPSVGQALAKVLGARQRRKGYLEGNGYIVSWCLGHLAEYVSPETYDEKYQKWEFTDLPIIPGEWRLAVAEDKKAQFNVLKMLLNLRDVEYVVNGCDAGREGELIFRRVYEMSGSILPVKRLWISSMEDCAIREGFRNLKDGRQYENLGEAAVCRAKADWLIGMNATRAFTTKYYKKLVIGRVQTPTLAMLVERQKKIDGFVREPFFKVSLEIGSFSAVSEAISNEAACDEAVRRCQGQAAVITKISKNQKKNTPPKLYDLTTLQREANRVYGYTAQETLKELQELYEDKLVTYPRTDSQYITEDMEQNVWELLEVLPEVLPFLDGSKIGRNVSRIIDNGKVSDHHALLPTKEAMRQDLGSLSVRQQNLFRLIGQRLAQAVSEDCIYEETEITVQCGGQQFQARGKAVIQPGFQDIASAFRKSVKMRDDGEKEETNENGTIPGGLMDGMEITSFTVKKSRHFTAPPKPYSEDTLLSAMENAGKGETDQDTEKKGLGTPATRAGIIEKLVSSGYAIRRGRQILPTADGTALIAVLPDYLKSAVMTAEWENKLLQMEKGRIDSGEFLQGIVELIGQVLSGCSEIPPEEQFRFHPREEIGSCPVCGSPVYEGKKNYYCGNRDCSFALWKENRYLAGMRKVIDKTMAEDLLREGRTHVTDFYSQKTGKTFVADLLMDVQDGRASFSLKFPSKKGRGTKGKWRQ